MIEELLVTADESENSRSGGQKQLKSFRFIHFRRKSPWLKELKIQKRFWAGKRGAKDRHPGLGTQDLNVPPLSS
jgi:hypothetical protein